MKKLKTFTFEYRGGEIRFNRLDGYSAWYAGNSLGYADSKVEAEALIDEARMRSINLEVTK